MSVAFPVQKLPGWEIFRFPVRLTRVFELHRRFTEPVVHRYLVSKTTRWFTQSRPGNSGCDIVFINSELGKQLTHFIGMALAQGSKDDALSICAHFEIFHPRQSV
jgi:hypothetical protein